MRWVVKAATLCIAVSLPAIAQSALPASPNAATPTIPALECCGDADGDGVVIADELEACVSIRIPELPPPSLCDCNHDGIVTVGEITHAVSNSVNGCPGRPSPTPPPSALPDLIEAGLVTHDLPPASGCITQVPTIDICVANIGEAPAGPFSVSGVNGAIRDEFFRLDGLAAGEQRCIEAHFPLDAEVTVTVDARNEVEESDEDNNARLEFVSFPPFPACTPTPTPTPVCGGGPFLAPVIGVGSATGVPGRQVTIPISLTKNGPLIVTIAPLVLVFDPGVLTFGGCAKTAQVSTGKSVITRVDVPDRVSIALYGDLVPIPDGEVLECMFAIAAGAAVGITPIVFVSAGVSDLGFNDINSVGCSGSVTVTPVPECVGDCDGDGQVVVTEIIIGVNVALNGDTNPSRCAAFNCPCTVASCLPGVTCILEAVNNALYGCPTTRPTPTARATER